GSQARSTWVGSATPASAAVTCAVTVSSAAPAARCCAVSPTQTSGSSPCRRAACTLRFTRSSVSAKCARRSEWPISSSRAPASLTCGTETSPVQAPSSSQCASWAPTSTSLPAGSTSATVAIAVAGGITNGWTLGGQSRAASTRAYVRAPASVLVIFQLVPIQVVLLVGSVTTLLGGLRQQVAGVVPFDGGDLRTGAGARVELVAEPFLGEAAGELDTDHALPEAEHLGVVRQHRPLHRVGVVGGDGADAVHLVRRDRHAHPGAAHQQRPVRLAVDDPLSGGHGDVRVV